jgi:hypothetical protein
MRTTGIVAVALMLAVSTVAQAQTGLYVGAQVTGTSLNYRDAAQKLDAGQGVGGHVGLSIGGSFGVLVNYDKSTLGSTAGDADVGQTDVLGRMGLMAIGPIKTSVLGGYTARVVKSDTYKLEGKNLTAGVMASVFTFRSLSLDGTVLWTFGELDPSWVKNATTVATKSPTGARVSLGASWYVFGGN